LAKETADSIVTSGAIEASGTGAIIDILRAVGSSPAVDANAGESTVGVGTSSAVLADARPQSTFIDVLITIRPRKGRWTLACVGIDAIDASGSILA
jgi:hypothetical protein